jgi:fimbrial chaperone protein
MLIGLIPISNGGIAQASSFQINPIRITLTPQGSSSLLTVRNESKERLRFQIDYFAWDQSKQGEMILNPTDDLVVYPTLLSVDGGQERNVRVGVKSPIVSREKSYRLFIEELPSAQTAVKTGIRILTRMGVPVFLQPQKPNTQGQIDKMAVRNSELFFEVINHGNVHFMPRAIRVKGTDSTGVTALEQQVQAWYILAGGSRDYRLEIPKTNCPKIKDLTVEVALEANILKEQFALPASACTQ